jgi:hypothetical protein
VVFKNLTPFPAPYQGEGCQRRGEVISMNATRYQSTSQQSNTISSSVPENIVDITDSVGLIYRQPS